MTARVKPFDCAQDRLHGGFCRRVETLQIMVIKIILRLRCATLRANGVFQHPANLPLIWKFPFVCYSLPFISYPMTLL